MNMKIGCVYMDKKGFTLIELIATIVLLSLVLIFATYSLSNYLKQGREKSFKLLVNSFEDSVLEAYTSCISDPNSSEFCKNHEIPDYAETDTIKLSELVDEYFIENVKNPWNTNETCDLDSYVTVYRNSIDNISFYYYTCLKCGTHESYWCDPETSS